MSNLNSNLVKSLPTEIKMYIFQFFNKQKCDYCKKKKFIFNMTNLLHSSHYFFFEKKKKYAYKCIECYK